LNCECALRLVRNVAKGRPYDTSTLVTFPVIARKIDATPGYDHSAPVSIPPLSIGGAFVEAFGNFF
jgi:hypothetical protein